MEFTFLKIAVEDGIATVALDRPPVNAITVEFRLEIIAAFEMLSERSDVSVAILTGAGNVFSGGIDLKAPSRVAAAGDSTRSSRITTETSLAIRECSKPVIAAINGSAIGTGFALAAACDIMVSEENAVFAMPEVTFGFPTGAAMLHSLFGRSKGRRLYFTGAKLTAKELYRLGLVEACVPRERVMDEAMVIAREIARQSPLVLRVAKQVYNAVEVASYREGKAVEQAMTPQLVASDDFKEARRAAAEERKPNYTGR